MPGADEVGGAAFRIEDCGDRRGPFPRGDPGAGGLVVYRHGEGGAQGRRVGLTHHRQLEPLGDVGEDREADLPPAVGDHEVHDAWRGGVAGADKIPFVLTVLGIHHDHALAPGDGGHCGVDRGELGGHRWL